MEPKVKTKIVDKREASLLRIWMMFLFKFNFAVFTAFVAYVVSAVLSDKPSTVTFCSGAECKMNFNIETKAEGQRLELAPHLRRTKDETFFGSGQMFDRIAAIYDITNKVMSFGLDRKWRTYMVSNCLYSGDTLLKPMSVLDLATGTADVALEAAQQAKAKASVETPEMKILGVDPSAQMIAIGRDKVADASKEYPPKMNVTLEIGDAQDLREHFPERDIGVGGDSPDPGYVDGITMSFGIRNVNDKLKGLNEMHRVLKENGKLCILEFNLPDPRRSFIARIASLFITQVIPFIGRVMGSGTSDNNEYAYFQQSIAGFPKPTEFALMMNSAGFKVNSITNFVFGAVQLYDGSKVL
jgi:demethylmenaquinone methyltransferase/2-methoxy-6-polyprenyl-1,4-benzoquinol methylase